MARRPTLRYFWQGVDWAAEPSADRRTLDAEARLMTRPDPLLAEALDAFLTRFYEPPQPERAEDITEASRKQAQDFLAANPALGGAPLDLGKRLIPFDPFHSPSAPWVAHKAALAFYFGLHTLDDKLSSLTRRDRFRLYMDALKERLSQPWRLSWHWRAILPYVRDWDPDDRMNLIVQACQVRQWELLLCYRVNEYVSIDNLPRLSVDDKALARPPLFGQSHRILRWDVYRLFYQPLVLSSIRAQVEDIRREPASADRSLKLAYVLGRHDCYYQIESITLERNALKITVLPFVDVRPDLDPLDSSRDGLDHRPLTKPQNLIDLPAFGSRKGASVLLASDHYCKALDQLSEVLNDPTARSVFIQAAPGSGKEQLSQTAYLCRSSAGGFAATSLGAGDTQTLYEALFTLTDVDRCVDERGTLVDSFVPKPLDGLAFQAVGGALFVDEIDKNGESARNMLLRFLETGEVSLPQSTRIVRLQKHQIPLYIFAGSATVKQLIADKPPPDFWTRISHIVSMKHPLDIDDDEREWQRVLGEYIRMFWRAHVKEFLSRSGHVGTDALKASKSAGLYRQVIAPYFVHLQLFLLTHCVMDFVRIAMTEGLNDPQHKTISIRRIRSIVSRAVFRVIELFLHS